MSYITVVGLVEGTHLIQDIRMDVPKGIVVNIPEELAYKSKDLWRAINQRQIFQLASPTPRIIPSLTKTFSQEDIDVLRQKIVELEQKNRILEDENVTLRFKLHEHQSNFDKLDLILNLVKNQPAPTVVVQQVSGSGAPTSKAQDVYDEKVPMFIPESIKPKDVSMENVEIQKDRSESSSVSNASSRLRDFKKKTGQ